jgi:hypothetical protein
VRHDDRRDAREGDGEGPQRVAPAAQRVGRGLRQQQRLGEGARGQEGQAADGVLQRLQPEEAREGGERVDGERARAARVARLQVEVQRQQRERRAREQRDEPPAEEKGADFVSKGASKRGGGAAR